MPQIKIVIVGAGSRSFGPTMINDVLCSDSLCQGGVELGLMDVAPDWLTDAKDYAERAARKFKRDKVKVTSALALADILPGADFVISLVERKRNLYWSQDYHIPRKYGFHQIYGENGGPGGAFHGLRNFPLVVGIAREMDKHCPDAVLLNLSNPESRIIEAVAALTKIRGYGFCHGVHMGQEQVGDLLERPQDEMHFVVAGLNHFGWFLKITDKKTGQDIYPALREADKKIAPAYEWRRMGLSRVLFRRTGLWPTPGTDHIGEYIGWAQEFMDHSLQWVYDPQSEPEKTVTEAPQFIYPGWRLSISGDPTTVKYPKDETPGKPELPDKIEPSWELLIPFIEAAVYDKEIRLKNLIVPNKGYIPNLPEDQSVEIPAVVNAKGVWPETVGPLPEFIAAMCRLQLSIQKLLLEAYVEESKAKLIQAMLLEPTVTSYTSCIAMIDEFLEKQKDVLPEFH